MSRVSTLLALLAFIAALALLGAVLGYLSTSSGALSLRRWARRQTTPPDDGAPEMTDSPADTHFQQTQAADTHIQQTQAADTHVEQTIPPAEQLIERVNACLPQTQCAQCGHPGCRPYATAIINDEAPINQCPPGGEALIHELADLLGKEFLPLDAERGETKAPQVALIDEPLCIGCTLCIAACPVDAIVGASKLMHTVVIDQCTGCELCLPPCPVDCISLVPADDTLAHWHWPKPA